MSWKPQQTLNIVVLPAPLGPINPVMRPGAASRETLSRATSPPKRTTMSDATRPSTEYLACRLLGPGRLGVAGLPARRAEVVGFLDELPALDGGRVGAEVGGVVVDALLEGERRNEPTEGLALDGVERLENVPARDLIAEGLGQHFEEFAVHPRVLGEGGEDATGN